jgi:DNA repair exonuclease SbcCD ATPase subunit
MKTKLFISCIVLLMTLSNSIASGQEKSACDKLVERMESEAKDYKEQIKDLTANLKTLNQKVQKDSAELQTTKTLLKDAQEKLSNHEKTVKQLNSSLSEASRKWKKDSVDLHKTKALLEKEKNEPRKEQIKRQNEQIRRLQNDSTAMSKTISAITDERDRLKSVETERTRIKTGYDSIVAELYRLRLERANDTLKLYAENAILREERDNKQFELNQLVISLNKMGADYDSVSVILNGFNERLAKSETEFAAANTLNAARELLEKEYSKAEIDKALAELAKISASSTHNTEAERIRKLLTNYPAKTKNFEDLQKQINSIESAASSMTMKAQYLKVVFSWIKNDRNDAGIEFREYPFLSRKLQEMIIEKINILTKE